METLLMILPALLGFAFVIGGSLLIIYAIYRAIKGLMTHSANLKNQSDNDNWQNPQSR